MLKKLVRKTNAMELRVKGIELGIRSMDVVRDGMKDMKEAINNIGGSWQSSQGGVHWQRQPCQTSPPPP